MLSILVIHEYLLRLRLRPPSGMKPVSLNIHNFIVILLHTSRIFELRSHWKRATKMMNHQIGHGLILHGVPYQPNLLCSIMSTQKWCSNTCGGSQILGNETSICLIFSAMLSVHILSRKIQK